MHIEKPPGNASVKISISCTKTKHKSDEKSVYKQTSVKCEMIKEVKVVKADRTERVKTANIAESAWRVKIQKQQQQTMEKHC